MTGEDRTIICRDCGQEFVFSAGEQEFFAQREFADPVRCSGCRQERRRARTNGDPAMASAPRSAPREMFAVICDQCGVETQVPFQPRQGRPVYCRECFQQMRA
jgi:CxxC-x17-CxxC domain-containing protein